MVMVTGLVVKQHLRDSAVTQSKHMGNRLHMVVGGVAAEQGFHLQRYKHGIPW